MFLLKEDNQISEQTFKVAVTVGPYYNSLLPTALSGKDYTAGAADRNVFIFYPNEQNTTFPFALYHDDIFESVEVFQLQLSKTRDSVAFSIGKDPAVVYIRDDEGTLLVRQAANIVMANSAWQYIYMHCGYLYGSILAIVRVCIMFTSCSCNCELHKLHIRCW